MIKLIKSNQPKQEPLSIQLIFEGILVIAFLCFLSYKVYESTVVNRFKGYYKSNIDHQYAHIYHLQSNVFFSNKDDHQYWEKMITEQTNQDISEFCVNPENASLNAITHHQNLKQNQIPSRIKSKNLALITATLEFECREIR